MTTGAWPPGCRITGAPVRGGTPAGPFCCCCCRRRCGPPVPCTARSGWLPSCPGSTLAERLRRARRGGRLDRCGGGLHGNRRNAPDRAFGAQVVPVHGQRALHTRGGAEHARAHIVGVQRYVRAAGDESGREARIDPARRRSKRSVRLMSGSWKMNMWRSRGTK